MAKRLLFFFLYSSTYLGTLAQTTVLQKGIVSSLSGERLPFVNILDSKSGKKTQSNINGVFFVNNEGQAFVFSSEGYQTFRTTLTHDSVVFVHLKSTDRTIRQALVTHKNSSENIRKLRDVENMTINAGRKTEVVGLNNMLVNKTTNNARQIFSKVVGLTIDEGSDGGLQLNIGSRGLNPNRSANFNTRQNLYDISADVLGYPESYYTPAANGIREIQIIRGAASLQYGTQFGGMVNFKMKEAHPQSTDANLLLSYGSRNLSSIFVDGAFAKKKWGVYGYYDFKNGNGYRPHSHYHAHNAFLSFFYQFNEQNKVNLDWVKYAYLAQQPGGLTDKMFYDNPQQSNRPRNWFRIDWNILNLRYEHIFSPEMRISVNTFGLIASRSALGFRNYNVASADQPIQPRDLLIGDFRNWGAELRFVRNYKLGKQDNVLLAGFKYYQSNNASDQGPADSTRLAHFDFLYNKYPNYPKVSHFKYPNLNLAFFAENIFHLSPTTSITPGFRIEKIKTEINGYYDRVFTLPNGILSDVSRHHDKNIKDRYIPLFGIGFSHRHKAWELYANVSQNYRSVTFSDLHSITPGFAISPDITDEKGFSSDIGIRGRKAEKLYYDASVFALYYGDKIGEYFHTNKTYNTVERYRDNVGIALTYGIESLINWNIGATFFPHSIWGMSTFINTSFTGSRYLKSDVPNIQGNAVEFVPLLNLHYGFEVSYKTLKANLLLTYVSEQYSDATNQPQRKDDNRYGVFGTIPAYYVMDLNVNWIINKHIDLTASLQNLTNHSYFTRRATGYPGPGIIPSERFNFIITLGLHL